MKKLLIATLILSLSAYAEDYLKIAEQGSFTVGGKYVSKEGVFNPDDFLNQQGQRAYGDYAYVFYQKPVEAKKLPLIFQHGGAQSKRTWESTFDGREGFNNLFLRKGYSVYLLDQPRSGEANLSTKPISPNTPWVSNPNFADKTFYILSRIGHFDEKGNPIPNAQFPEGEENYQAFQQSWSVGSGDLDNDLNAEVLSKLVDKVGEAILITHSMGGTIGWRTAVKNDKVKAIVAWEAGGTEFLFPENEMPEIIEATFKPLSAAAKGIPMEEFKRLTEIPILLIYGDYIDLNSKNIGENKWATELEMAKKFVHTVNKHGGDAKLIHLPEIGIKGNSHFLMSEKNNQELADLMAEFLKEKGLDK